MLRSFYQGISGMKAMMEGVSTTGNNIANSKTTGYKAQKANFEDLFYQSLQSASGPNESRAGRNPIDIGNGVRLKNTSINFQQGIIVPSGKSTDLAISGNGFFVVGDADSNNKLFTRDGSFSLSQNKELVTADGKYVLGWNTDETGVLNTAAGVSPIRINLNQMTDPIETTEAMISGNLNADDPVGTIKGFQIPAYDTLGAKHDVNVNFIKVSDSPNEYRFIANSIDDFIASDSIKNAVFRPSEGIANQLMKGDYRIATSDNGDGTVNIELLAPNGDSVLTRTITDTTQTITLNDGENDWFTIDYVKGNAPSTATFQVAEAGSVSFDNYGNINQITGSGAGSNPQLDFHSLNTGNVLSIDMDISQLTGIVGENTISLESSDGFPSATLSNFDIMTNGAVVGYFTDGSVKAIAQLSLATFSNENGLSLEGGNYYSETVNSGVANIGAALEGERGEIRSHALEQSNTDIAEELTDLLSYQKAYTANSKTISISNEMMDVSISLVR